MIAWFSADILYMIILKRQQYMNNMIMQRIVKNYMKKLTVYYFESWGNEKRYTTDFSAVNYY